MADHEQSDSGEDTPPPNAGDLVQAVVDVARGKRQKRDWKGVAWLLGLLVTPLAAHWGLNAQAKKDAPSPAVISEKLEYLEGKQLEQAKVLTDVAGSVKTINANMEMLTRFVIGDRQMADAKKISATPTAQGRAP